MSKTLHLSAAALLLSLAATASHAQQTVPYRASFEASDAGWTTIDNSTTPGTTWHYTEYGLYDMGYYYHCVETARDFDSPYDDYFVSPAITLEKGKTYNVATATAGAGVTTAMTLTLELGTSATDASTYTSLATLPMEQTYTASNPTTNTVTVEESGTYHFAFHAVGTDPSTSVRAYLFNFQVSTDDTTSTPDPTPDPGQDTVKHEIGDVAYTSDLSSTTDWTIIDSNADGVTWGALTGVGNATYNSDNATKAADDWLISPAIALQGGMDYTVSYTLAQQGSFDADQLSVMAGEEPTANGLDTYVSEETIADNSGAAGKARFICEESGKYYFGFHLTTPNGENGQISLTSLTITATAKATPKAVENLEAELTEDKTVILRWDSPTEDTEDMELIQTIGLNIYENGTLIKTYDEVSPGAQGIEVVTPATTSGTATFKVETFVADNKGEAKTASVNIDDAVGQEELIKTFAISSSTKGNWVIEDNAGTGAWAFDYGTVFSFFYKLSNKTQDDWLISPAVDLEASKRYLLKYQLKTSRDYGVDLAVTIGNAQNSAAQTKTLASYTDLMQNGFGDYQTDQFAIPADGQYYVGFHVTNANYSAGVQNVQVYVINSTSGIESLSKAGAMVYNRHAAQLLVPTDATRVTILSANGSTVKSTVANGTVDLSSLPAGIYIVNARDAQGNDYRMKIVK